MLYRASYVENDLVLANSGTQIINLDIVDPISVLVIRMSATNHSGAANKQSPLARCISKIEIVDGSEVIYSLSGQQAIAQYYFDRKQMPHRQLNEWVGNSQQDHFPIYFGRYMGDKQYALDPKRFKKLQLKITWNLATVNAVGSGGFATGTGRLTVIAHLMENGVSPIGFFLMKEHYSWTLAASGVEPIPLPNDYPYRKLYVRAYEGGTELTSAITNLKLNCDSDKFIPFDLGSTDFIRMMQSWFGRAHQEYQWTADNEDTKELWGDMEISCLGNIEGQEHLCLNLRDPWVGRVMLEIFDTSAAEQTGKSGHLQARFICPESTFCFPFGDQDDPSDAFPVGNFENIKLQLTQGDADGAGSVCLQQIRNY